MRCFRVKSEGEKARGLRELNRRYVRRSLGELA
jgi:hypothetical protein